MRDKHQRYGRYLRTTHKKAFIKRKILLFAACILLFADSFDGTLAYIITNTTSITNKFTPAQVSCEILEDFSDGISKKDVRVQNTGDAPAYIRVKLLPYWYDKENDTIIAKTSWTPSFTPDVEWVLGEDGYWYYTYPVNPGECTSALIPSLALDQDDVSLARQVLEIIASCIQAEPADAVKDAWSGTNGSVIDVSDNTLTVKGG